MGLCKVEKGHTYTLDEFRNAQFEQLEEVQYVQFFFIVMSSLINFAIVFIIAIIIINAIVSHLKCFLLYIKSFIFVKTCYYKRTHS